ncbi:uncharacterized protein LOC118733475 [Rhagoletis pomonella]|uniref:uncharacterized protein LOC118733475 n=1 Tax=Rhagoletis pomonella TaxID=28610 RepID=UPI001785A4FC|nr:uncharacterized protein LOC118733475 [Rhagoletis pomonella]
MALQDGIPDFLRDQFVFSDTMLVGHKRHCFILARNLKFYEFCQKQLVNSTELRETCLKKVANDVRDYKGPRGKCFKSRGTRNRHTMGSTEKPAGLMETSDLQTSVVFEEEPVTNLVVIALPNHAFVAEFERVTNFRIVHGKALFEAVIEILFENGTTQCSNFQKSAELLEGPAARNIVSDRNSLKQLLERVRFSKSELQLHRSTTQKEFDALRDQEMFGCNYIRSDQLEEKPMLSRCGDIWIRFVGNNMVFGVPLVNNCSKHNLIILKNLKPILKINDFAVDNIIYKYRLYQLRLNFENLETMESFFQTEDEDLRLHTQVWNNSELPQLLPASFAVVLVVIKTTQLLLLENCPLFLYFEIEKELPNCQGRPVTTGVYEQHLFLKNLNISHILINRQKYQLSFSSPCIHQDFLANALISKEATIHIKFLSVHNALIFEQLIAEKLNFNTVKRDLTSSEYEMNHTKDVDDKLTQNQYVSSIYFNKDQMSLWFGSMIIKINSDADGEDEQTWKFYLQNKEKAFICLKMLFSEITMVNCKIKNMEYLGNKQENTEGSFFNIKKALFDELEGLKHLNESINNTRRRQILEELMKNQISSDIFLRTGR